MLPYVFIGTFLFCNIQRNDQFVGKKAQMNKTQRTKTNKYTCEERKSKNFNKMENARNIKRHVHDIYHVSRINNAK